ncbi:MAG: sulfatase-like hydrolase/transferase [Anaerolineales bacterium]|nr:sulfatase-like hydrolase/transferase [Anaerolineales bacterium]
MSKQPNNKQKLTRRTFLRGAGTVAVGTVAGSTGPFKATAASPDPARAAQAGEGPNILLILVDQERFALNFPDSVKLPNHQRLQKQGLTFTNYHVTTGLCTPSRSVIYTGQHTINTRMTDNTDFPYISDLALSLPTIGHMLRQAGYYTAYKGKWHLSELPDARLDPDGRCYQVDEAGEWLLDKTNQRVAVDTGGGLEPYGFADFNPCGRTDAEQQGGYEHDPETAADAVDWLLNRSIEIASGQPWFLAVNFVNPHDVMYFDSDGPEGDVQTSEAMEIVGAPDEPWYRAAWQPPLPRSFYEDDLSTKPPAHRDFLRLDDFAYGEIPKDRLDLWEVRQNYYINCVRDVDRHVGTVLDALEASGQAGQTLIIFTADHGELGGAHGLRQKGNVVYKENNNVPLIVADPHRPALAGATTTTLVSSVDLAPTLLSLAGMTAANRRLTFPNLIGYDFSATLDQPAGQGERDEKAGGVLFTFDALSHLDPDAGRKLQEIQAKRAAGEPLDLAQYRPIIDFSKRGYLRGIYDGRYKFARYFSPLDYHIPADLESLLARNDIELYDTQIDPDEIVNLADPAGPNFDPALIRTMNDKLNTLIQAEIGADEGTLPIPRLGLLS